MFPNCYADAQPSQNGVLVEEDANGQLVALNPRKRIKFALAEKEVCTLCCYAQYTLEHSVFAAGA